MKIYNNVNQYSTFSIPKPVDSSFYRKLIHIVSKAFHDIWVTLASYFGRVKMSKETNAETLKTFNHSVAAIMEVDYTLPPIVNQLQRTSNIGPGAVKAFAKSLKATYSFDMVDGYLYPAKERTIPLIRKEEDIKLLAVPVVVSGTVRDHIVTFLIDRTIPNQVQIEFYDSKGLSLLDRKGEKLLSDPIMDLKDLYEKLADYYGATKLVENTVKHQYDSHNCGIYVCDYYSRRVNGETPETIAAHGKNYSEANSILREKMIAKICEYALGQVCAASNQPQRELPPSQSTPAMDDGFAMPF